MAMPNRSDTGEQLALAQYAQKNKDSLSTVQLSDVTTNVLTISPGAPREHLVELAHYLEQSDTTLKASVGSKLQILVDQMRLLQAQARIVLEEAQRDADLHRAACNFQKRPGTIYHLYQKKTSSDETTNDNPPYLSMLSPEDWGGMGSPHNYLGSYRLEADQSWTPIERIREREDSSAFVQTLLQGNLIKYSDKTVFDQVAALESSSGGRSNSLASITSSGLSSSHQQKNSQNQLQYMQQAQQLAPLDSTAFNSLTPSQRNALVSYRQSHEHQFIQPSTPYNPVLAALQAKSVTNPVPHRSMGNTIPLPSGAREPSLSE